jgi:excisionase family DNA binding protein
MTFVKLAVYTIAEACAAARIGRSTLYKHIRVGDLRAIKIGSRTCVPVDELYRWLNAMPCSISVLHSSSGNAGDGGSGAETRSHRSAVVQRRRGPPQGVTPSSIGNRNGEKDARRI